MEAQLLKTLGQVAGIGGLALGILLLLFKDLLKKIVAPSMTKEQWFVVVVVFMFLVWSVALAGIGAWVWVSLGQSGIDSPQSQVPRDASAPSVALADNLVSHNLSNSIAKSETATPKPSGVGNSGRAAGSESSDSAGVSNEQHGHDGAQRPANTPNTVQHLGQVVISASNIGNVHLGSGDIKNIVNNFNYGIPSEQYLALADELAVNKAALDEVFKQLGTNLPAGSPQEKAKAVVTAFRALEERIKNAGVTKPDEIKTQSEALLALQSGNISGAQELANRLPLPPQNLRISP